MNSETIDSSPMRGIIRAKLNEGFVLRLDNNSTCFVPIKYLIGYTNDERYCRYDALDIGDMMEVVLRSVTRRPTASELQALEYRTLQSLRHNTAVEFYVESASPDGVAVRLLAPQSAYGQSAYIHRSRLDDDMFNILLRDALDIDVERVCRSGYVVSIRRNVKERLSVKLAC